jgi:lysophosphatidylcholine acyltransferase / lyso-PAF acetyltransferase
MRKIETRENDSETARANKQKRNDDHKQNSVSHLLLPIAFALIKAITPGRPLLAAAAVSGDRPPASSSMASTSPNPASLSAPLLSDSISPAHAANGHAANHRHHHDGAVAASVCGDAGDPFAFLSEDRPPRDRGPSPADPFRNGTPAWCGGAYAWARTLLLLPVAAVRLALFGLAIAIGYAATWVALRGWADTHVRPREGGGPMPAWRRRLMWITRISARCILFSFG